MKNSMKILMLVVMALSLTTISCEKEGLQGPAGPAGAMGEQGIAGPEGPAGQDGEALGFPGPAGTNGTDGATGAAGPTGPAGADGTNGTNGTDGEDGNANVISVAFDNIDIVIGNNSFDVPELTQEIFDTGFVLGYTRTTIETTKWETLPIVLSNEVRLDIDEISVGSLIVNSAFTQTLNFRFIIVEGNISGKTSRGHIKKMSYQEAMAYFGLDY